MTEILHIENLGISFGGLRAVDEFELSMKENELVGLIGPNGAGKTTIFNLLTGVYTPTDGKILLNNKDITGKKPNDIVLLGSCRTFQNIRLFKNMTVIDNIKIAYHNSMKYSYFGSVFKTKKYREEEAKAEKVAIDLLKVFELDSYQNSLAKNLPYGKQRKLEIARALATNPEVLLLDEPAAGMNPQETEELMETIKFIKSKFKISILLIEHDMKLVMGICERLIVVDYGKIIAKGSPEQIRKNPQVIKAYLGV
ncbi:MAG: ABC transporter ATP-binding protein [Sphaerochaetaceae bacterium]|nr:ABC transporter ATP-binding protein [Sphaerochaetaceae bacterium]